MSHQKSQEKTTIPGTMFAPGSSVPKRLKRIQPMPLEGLVVVEQILLHYPVGKSTLYKEIKKGSFPAQTVRKGRTVFWDAAEVRRYLKSIGATIQVPSLDTTEAKS